MTREDAAQQVLDECFWGDYRFDVPTLLSRVDEGSDYFDRFLVDRIVKNAVRPSHLLIALYSPDRVLSLIPASGADDYLDYHERRRAVVRANVSGDYDDPAVRSWVW